MMSWRRGPSSPFGCVETVQSRVCVYAHGVNICCMLACPLISQGTKRGCSPTVTVGAARRKPLSHDTDPGARRSWSKINARAIPEMPLFKSQRRGEERG